MYIKIHRSYRNVVAVCDTALLGKKFEEGKRQLDVRENFFKGKDVDEKEALKIFQLQFREDATFNIVGEESVALALRAGIISEEGITTIQGISFALKLM